MLQHMIPPVIPKLPGLSMTPAAERAEHAAMGEAAASANRS